MALFSFEGGGGIKCATTFWTQALGLAVPSGGPRPRVQIMSSHTAIKEHSRLIIKCVQFLVFFSTQLSETGELAVELDHIGDMCKWVFKDRCMEYRVLMHKEKSKVSKRFLTPKNAF